MRERCDGGLIHVEQAQTQLGEMDAAGFCGGGQKRRCLPAKRNPRYAERASADSCKRINIAEAK